MAPRFLALQGMWTGAPIAAVTNLGDSSAKYGPTGPLVLDTCNGESLPPGSGSLLRKVILTSVSDSFTVPVKNIEKQLL